MNEKDLIRQLKGLREIEPRKDWVVFTKKRIFAGEMEIEPKAGLLSFFPLFRYKLAFAPIVSVLIIIGLFGFAQQTIPGDFLFSVKKAAETAQVTFSSEMEKSGTHLKLANKRLEELSRIADNNQVRNLGPAIKEFQLNIVQATKNLEEMSANVTSSDSAILKEIVFETQRLEENKEKVEQVLGAIIGDTKELTNAILQLEKQTASYLIADLSQRTFSEEKQGLFEEAKQDFEAGNYSRALEKIWMLHNY